MSQCSQKVQINPLSSDANQQFFLDLAQSGLAGSHISAACVYNSSKI